MLRLFLSSHDDEVPLRTAAISTAYTIIGHAQQFGGTKQSW